MRYGSLFSGACDGLSLVIPKAKYPARSNRLKGLGNAVVPQCAYIAARRLLEQL